MTTALSRQMPPETDHHRPHNDNASHSSAASPESRRPLKQLRVDAWPTLTVGNEGVLSVPVQEDTASPLCKHEEQAPRVREGGEPPSQEQSSSTTRRRSSRRQSQKQSAAEEEEEAQKNAVTAVPLVEFQLGDLVLARDLEFEGRWFPAQIVCLMEEPVAPCATSATAPSPDDENHHEDAHPPPPDVIVYLRIHYLGYREIFDEKFPKTATDMMRPISEEEAKKARRLQGRDIRTVEELLADRERLLIPWKPEPESEEEEEAETEPEPQSAPQSSKEPVVPPPVVKPEFLPYNPSGCARMEVYQRSDRYRNPYYRARIHPIHVPGWNRPLRVPLRLGNTAAADFLEDGHGHPLSSANSELMGIVVPTSGSHVCGGDRAPKPSAKATFFVSDSAANNLPMALRFRQVPELAKRRLRVSKSLIHGWGIFAIEPIEENDMILEYIGEVIGQNVANYRERENDLRGVDLYMFRIGYDEIVDATRKGNQARFINHSCEPNCYSKVIMVDGVRHIMIFAARRIEGGEELTYDYKLPLEKDRSKKILCGCGTGPCGGYMN